MFCDYSLAISHTVKVISDGEVKCPITYIVHLVRKLKHAKHLSRGMSEPPLFVELTHKRVVTKSRVPLIELIRGTLQCRDQRIIKCRVIEQLDPPVGADAVKLVEFHDYAVA